MTHETSSTPSISSSASTSSSNLSAVPSLPPCIGKAPMNVNVNDLLKEQPRKFGYLKKLGGKGISKNWRKRFFILTGDGILYYFKHRTSNEPVGCVDLSLYTKVYKDESKKNLFYISNENDQNTRVFHLISENGDDQEQWTQEINAFFEGDISELKSHLMDVQKKKQFNTLTKNELKHLGTSSSLNDSGGTPGSTTDSFLDNYQLVFRGHRISLVSNSSTSTSSSASSTANSPQPPPRYNNSNSSSHFNNSSHSNNNSHFNNNNVYLGNSNENIISSTTSTTSTSTSISSNYNNNDSNVKVAVSQDQEYYYEDDDQDDD